MAVGSTKRDNCRLCGNKNVELVVAMTPTPIADAYVTRDHVAERQSVYPLDLYLCHGCGHVQLLDVVNPHLMFKSEYTYQSGSSGGIVRHFQEYVDAVLARENPPKGALVVDIGSNDGTFLSFFQKAGMTVLGIDPATELARASTARGIETLPHFLNPELADTVRKERGAARILTANNVFAHADDLGGMADSIQRLLAPDGAFVFEVSYVVDVVDQMLLGTIFHEHLCYHAVKPLKAFLARHGMELVDVEHVTVQGGSLIVTAQPTGGHRKASARVEEMIREEETRGFDKPEIYRNFNRRIDRLKSDLEAVFKGNGPIAGYGAARGGTTLIYRLNLDGRLAFIVDDSPAKQDMFSPGDHVPILSSDALYDQRPSHVFILAWVHWKAIVQAHRRYMEQGGRFVIAHPRVEVMSAGGNAYA